MLQKKKRIVDLTNAAEDAQKAIEEAKKEVEAESDGEVPGLHSDSDSDSDSDDEDGLTGSLAAGAGLMGRKRGETVEVKVKGKYNAAGYAWLDVCNTCEKLESGEWKLAWLNPGHKHHDPKTMKLPRQTAARYMMDDSKVMKAKGLKGVAGTRHWRVERDVRRRTSLRSAGGYLGTGEPMLGTAAEDALMVYMHNQSKRGTPLVQKDVEELLRDAAIKIGATNQLTGHTYGEDTNVRKLTEAFLARCKARGVPFTEKNGQGLSLQRAQAATVTAVQDFAVKVI